MPNPNTIPYVRYQDIQIPDASTREQYIGNWSAGNYKDALDLINTPQFNSKAYMASTINRLISGILTLQNKYNDNVTIFLSDLAQQWFALADNFRNRQAWNDETQYVPFNIVTYGDYGFLCIQDAEIGVAPVEGDNWIRLDIKGAEGAPGVDVNIRFDWNNVETYQPNDLVIYDGNVYVALETNTNVEPTSDPSKWLLFLVFGKGEIYVGSTPPQFYTNDTVWFETDIDITSQNNTNPVSGQFNRYNESLSDWEIMYPNTVHTQIIGGENLAPVAKNFDFTIQPTDWVNNNWTFTYGLLGGNSIVDILPNGEYSTEQIALYTSLSLSIVGTTITLTKPENIEIVSLPIIVRIW